MDLIECGFISNYIFYSYSYNVVAIRFLTLFVMFHNPNSYYIESVSHCYHCLIVVQCR